MKTKTLILTLLTVALLLPAVALTVSAELSVYGSYVGLGDLDADRKVNKADYAILKHHILKTHTLPERLICSADINLDGKVSSADYMMLKRMVLKTYQPDYSWRSKPAEELTDEELWKKIRYNLARFRVEGELIVDFRKGMDEATISEALASVGLSPDLKNHEQYTYVSNSDPDHFWLTMKTEEALLPELYFALSRCDAVESVIPNFVSVAN